MNALPPFSRSWIFCFLRSHLNIHSSWKPHLWLHCSIIFYHMPWFFKNRLFLIFNCSLSGSFMRRWGLWAQELICLVHCYFPMLGTEHVYDKVLLNKRVKVYWLLLLTCVGPHIPHRSKCPFCLQFLPIDLKFVFYVLPSFVSPCQWGRYALASKVILPAYPCSDLYELAPPSPV